MEHEYIPDDAEVVPTQSDQSRAHELWTECVMALLQRADWGGDE